MNDTDLREMFHRRERDVRAPFAPPPRTLRRARRRQVGTVLVAVVAAAVLVLVPVAGLVSLGSGTADRVGNPQGSPPPGTQIGTGSDPEGGDWTLSIANDAEGVGLSFVWTSGEVGETCCLSDWRFAQPLQLDGTFSEAGRPTVITAFADHTTRVVGRFGDVTIEGTVFSVPDEYPGAPQVAVVIVPGGGTLDGELVAYDGDGNEICRIRVRQTEAPNQLPYDNIDGRETATGSFQGTPWKVEQLYYQDGIRLTIGGTPEDLGVLRLDDPIVRAVDGSGYGALVLVLTDLDINSASVTSEGSWNGRWMPSSTGGGAEARLWVIEVPGAGSGTLELDGLAAAAVRWP